MEAVTQLLRMLLPLVTGITTGLAIYNINRLVLLSPALRKVLVIVTALVAAPMVVAPLFFDVVPLSKLVLAYLMFLACVGSWAILALAPHGKEALIMLEQDCSQLRDVSVLGGTQVRAQLAEVAEKLRRKSEPDQREATALLLRSVSPVVMLFFAKEKSALKWGMHAFTLARSLVKYFSAQKKNEA